MALIITREYFKFFIGFPPFLGIRYALGVAGIGFLLIILLLVHDHNALDKQEHPEVHDDISNTDHLRAGIGLGEGDDIT